jgi:hypothetical protein
VADPSLRDTPLTVVINWNDPFAEEQDKITVVAVDWVNDNGVFSRSHTYASAPDPGDPTNIRITVSAADDDGGNTVAERMPTIPGTGLASIPFDVTPETPQFIFELPTVVSSPLTIESTVEVIQTTDFRTGQAGPSQGSNEQLILKSLNPDGSENPEEISIGRENERPEDVLRRLPEIFKQLTDGEYRIYLKREDGTRRLVLNVILRRHKQIDPSELKKSGPPAVAEQKDGPDKKDAAPKASKTDAGPKLNAPEQGKATDKPVVAPKPNNRVSDPSTGDTRPAGAIPVRSTAATIPAGDSRNAAAVTAVAAWAGAEGIRRWRQQVDEEMTRWSNAGFMERKRRLSRTRRTLN